MSKYRPVDVRLWNDRKFLSLSSDGRLLWLFLLTTTSTLPIPGVVVGGDAALSEQIGWLPERFAERFGELFAKRLSVRREGRLIWLPNALKYQPPANPNVVKNWSRSWDDVPESDLKHELWQALKIACKTWSKLFAELFAEPFRDGLPNGSLNGLAYGSTQEQEQEQEHIGSAPTQPESDPKPTKRKARLPADWNPTDQHKALALSLGVDCDREAEQFRDHYAANGEPRLDWDASFRTWLRRAQQFGRGGKQQPAKPVRYSAPADADDNPPVTPLLKGLKP